MEDYILSLVILGRHSVCGTSAEVNPLEHFTWLVVVELSRLIDLNVPRHFADEGLNVRNGFTEPPLDLFASSNELVHCSLCAGHFEVRILILVCISSINFVTIIIYLIIIVTKLSIQHLFLNALVLPSTSRWLEPHNFLRLLLGDNLSAAIVDAHIKDHNEKHSVAILLVVVNGPVKQVVHGLDVSLQHYHGFFGILIDIFIGLENTILKLDGRMTSLIKLLRVDGHHDFTEIGRLALVSHDQQMLQDQLGIRHSIVQVIWRYSIRVRPRHIDEILLIFES